MTGRVLVRPASFSAATRLVARRFEVERVRAEDALRRARTPEAAIAAVVRLVDAGAGEWHGLFGEVYALAAVPSAEHVYRQLRAAKAWREPAADVVRLAVENWLRFHAGNRIRAISESLKSEVRVTLAEGVAQGEGIFELRERLREFWSLQSRQRAVVIARTEVIAAANLGAVEGAKATGYPMTKTWLATATRSRPAHAAASGQVRDLNEPFIVKGERLMFPGDTSLGAGAANVVCCRCAQTFAVRDDAA